LDSAGNVWGWGYTGYGQVGNGTSTGNVLSPQQVSTGTSYTAISAGWDHSLAVDADGNLWAWGRDAYGEGGNGALTGDVTTPQQISAGMNFTTVAAGGHHSISLDNDGRPWCWGSDLLGQVGNGAITGDVTAPQEVNVTIVTSITFDGVAGTNVQRLDRTRALVTTPPGSPGTAVIAIHYTQNGYSQPAVSLAHLFTYQSLPPTPATTPAVKSPTGVSAPSLPPTITLQPISVAVTTGEAISLTITAEGYPLPTVQWQKSTDNGSTWADLVGKTGWSLVLSATSELDGTLYRAVLTNERGTVTTETATVTVLSPPAPSPTVTASPAATPSPSATADSTDSQHADTVGGLWIVAGIALVLFLLFLGALTLRNRDA
jgi:hypothetical protein